MKNKKYYIFIFLFLIFGKVYSAFKEPTGGYGVRPTGLGGAYVAISDDSNGVFYNPAGVKEIDQIEGNFMYGMLYTGLGSNVNIGINNISVLYPISESKNGVLGIGWAGLNSENYKENTVILSYAPNLNKILTRKISFGLNFKYLHHSYILDQRTLDDYVFSRGETKGAISADLGLRMMFSILVRKNIYCGFIVRNLIKADVGIDKEDIVPSEYRLGAAYIVKDNFLYSLEVGYREQFWGEEKDKINYYTGLEKSFFNRLLALRLGANLAEYTAGFSIFFPLDFMDIQIDYAFILPIYIEKTTASHRIGLVVKQRQKIAKTTKQQKIDHKEEEKVKKPNISLQVIPKECYITITPQEVVPVNIYFNILCPAEKNINLCELKIVDEQGKIVKTYTQMSGNLPQQIIWDAKLGTNYVPEGKYSAILTCIYTSGITATLTENFEIIHKVIEPVKIVEVKEIVKEVPKEVKVIEEEKVIRLRMQSNVLFDFNSSKLSKSSEKILLNIIDLLKSYPENKIIIEGHTDSVGSDEYNNKLSLARANAVKEFLVSNGIPPERITEVKGFGKKNPVASNKTESGRAMNRRVEILIVK